MNTDAPLKFEMLWRRHKKTQSSPEPQSVAERKWGGEIPQFRLQSPAGASHWPNPPGWQEMREVE